MLLANLLGAFCFLGSLLGSLGKLARLGFHGWARVGLVRPVWAGVGLGGLNGARLVWAGQGCAGTGQHCWARQKTNNKDATSMIHGPLYTRKAKSRLPETSVEAARSKHKPALVSKNIYHWLCWESLRMRWPPHDPLSDNTNTKLDKS